MKTEQGAQPANAQAGTSELTINDLASDARGVGHAEGKAVFVEDALPGERVRYQLLRRHRRHDEAKLLKVLDASPQREVPPCPHFGRCGGCALQHLHADGQVQFKQTQLLNALQRIGKITPDKVLPPLTADVWGYRRRARLAVKYLPEQGGIVLGFRERSSAYIAQLESCDILAPAVGKQLPALRALLNSLDIAAQISDIEVAAGDNACALVLQSAASPSETDVTRMLEFSRKHDLWWFLQPGGPKTLVGLAENTPELHYDLPEYELIIGFKPADFLQVHAQVNELMVSQALSLLEVSADDEVLELFAGLGNFSLPLARKVKQVTTIESEADLVARAQANARANGITNLRTYKDDLFGDSRGAPWLRTSFNKVLLDPPRAGAREALPHIAAKNPSHIVYCSCHPATLARDGATLVNDFGYKLSAAGVVDMFPHTAHVEAMALFERS